MSPCFFGCVICGYQIYGLTQVTKQWLGEFRIIYCSAEGVVCLTGVGYHSYPGDNGHAAPSNPAQRWDDNDYVPAARDEIPVMSQYSEDGRNGFVLHDACWHLLRKWLEPDPIPLERLYNICRSLPNPLRGIGVCWEHGYDGLFPFDDHNHYPWEDSLMEYCNDSLASQYAGNNPYDIPGTSELLIESCKVPPYPDVILKHGEQGFTKLPWEIIETIAKLLSSGDTLNLCLSSKKFLPILTSQTFWASRFEAPHERHFFFESWNNKEQRDWRSLYRATGVSTCVPGLQNRRRIWKLLRNVVNLSRLCLSVTSSACQSLGDDRNCGRSEVCGDMKQMPLTRNNFTEGCMLLCKQRALIPQNLCKIAFSMCRIGDVEYITGLRLINCNNKDVRFGYITEGTELVLETTELKGFIIAMGSRGLKALRIVGNEGLLSQWYGCPDNSPVTEKLACIESANALEVGVDGYKLVSLAVTGPDLLHKQSKPDHKSSLRSMALWYPEVPPLALCLNDKSFTGEWPANDVYQPLFWVRFGGQNGANLQYLTGVSVPGPGYVTTIEFQYATDSLSPCKLGRRILSEYSRDRHFAIDGLGGERIESVAVSLERSHEEGAFRFYRHGKLGTLKLTTNRGRSIHFGTESKASNDPPTHSLNIIPGSTVTGFYASQHPECGLISLGVISEVLS